MKCYFFKSPWCFLFIAKQSQFQITEVCVTEKTTNTTPLASKRKQSNWLFQNISFFSLSFWGPFPPCSTQRQLQQPCAAPCHLENGRFQHRLGCMHPAFTQVHVSIKILMVWASLRGIISQYTPLQEIMPAVGKLKQTSYVLIKLSIASSF